MNALISRRKLLKSKLTRVKTKLEAHTEQPLDLLTANVYEEQIQEFWTQFNELFDEILSTCAEEEDEEHQGQYAEIAERFDDAKVAIRSIIQELTGTSQQSTNRRQSRESTHADVMKLPKLNVPTFSGNILEWTSFCDLFTSSIHLHPTLKGSQKLQYLKSALTGDAAALLESFHISDANYSEAWDTLRKRYQNLRELVKSHLSRFLDMPFLKCESGAELRTLVDTSSSVVRALKALKRPINDDCDLAVHIITTRLDSETHKLWETLIGRERIPTLTELLEFLDGRAAILNSTEVGKRKETTDQHKQKSNNNHKTAVIHQTSVDGACPVCKNGTHAVYSCKSFLELSVADRRGQTKKLSLCFNCLRPGHNAQKCFSKSTCKTCQSKHNTLLHLEQTPDATKKEVATVSAHTTQLDGETKRALLSTALINVIDAFGQRQCYRALIDPGAEVSCVTERCVQQLGISRRKAETHFSGLGASSIGRSKGIARLALQSRCDAEFRLDIDAYIWQKVTEELPKLPCEKSEIAPFLELKLADPSFHKPGAIDILLGADVFFATIRPGYHSAGENQPAALKTAWGWIVGGDCPSQNLMSASIHHFRCEDSNLDEILSKFWQVEEIPSKTIMTVEEKECEANFVRTTTRDDKGRFVVELPFKLNHPKLGASRQVAVKRLQQMERALQHKPEQKLQYIEFMRDYKSLGHMEIVPVEDLSKPDDAICYIPHHAIIGRKFRVVFDASSKTSSGYSLNDVLMVGPKLQDDLFVILVRFRMFIVAFTADIVKMFRQIWISQKHRDFQRIVWRDSPDQPIQDFRLTTVTYGTSSAPYLSKRCLQLLADQGQKDFPLASEIIGRDYYMDDLMSGDFNLESAIQVQQQTLHLMNSACMDLRKWSSCSEQVLEKIEPSMRVVQTPFRIDEDDVIKTLGLHWLPGPDMFWFKVIVPPERAVVTKRTISSDSAKVFDPLGLLSPVTIVGKILMQKLWLQKRDWDEEVPEAIREEWLQYQRELPKLEGIKIPRCVKSVHDSSYELVGFSDASETASAAMVYVRSTNADGNYELRLVAAKTKLAPLQQKSLPRLELNGAVLLVRLMKTVHDAFLTKPDAMHAFTDSTVVLAWLKEHPKTWNTYVANRVSEVQDFLPFEQWSHVSGVQNPVDCASRGIRPSELVSHPLWWEGPEFLKLKGYTFEKPQIISDVALLEQRKNLTISHVTSDITLLHKFSSLTKLQRVTAYCKRFSANCKIHESKRKLSFLSSDELRDALHIWIRIVQEQAFATELQALSGTESISVKSRLRSLNPFVDSCGLLRVGGRLRHAKLSDDRKHPILLPTSHILTTLVITQAHTNTMHGGCQMVLAAIQRKFWIVNGRDAVRRQIRKCVKCCRIRADTAVQMMGDLPSFRVNSCRAFLKVGIDFAGPYTLRVLKGRGNRNYKGYIVIFICMVTRAMHLEVATSLSSESFIAVLKRFVARRGLPSHIYSDCGRTFIGANKEIQRLLKSQEFSSEVGEYAAQRGISWKFNPPASPHFGGLWEAGIRSVKHHMQRIMGNLIFNYEDMHTVISQIEACLNSRPLTQLSPDPNDLCALTPGHFLIGDALTAVPEITSEEPATHLSRWRLMQRVVQHFWKRWSAEYLARLQQRPKWLKMKPTMNEGDLVIIKDERLPPLKWKLARVLQGHPGPDGITRVYTVKTSEGVFKRPLVKLCQLPIETTE